MSQNIEHQLKIALEQASYWKIKYQEERELALEEAAQVVDTACCADESLRKLAQAIRDLKSE